MKRSPQNVSTITNSFRHYGLGDIKHNQSKPIAALILAICFIDQLASFRYRKGNLANKWEKFVFEYMPDYKELNIYSGFRNTLIHNYSASTGRFAISNDPNITECWREVNGCIIINTNKFIEKTEYAFELYVKDLENRNLEAYHNTIKRSISHPVLVHVMR
jgi:hypothetical protein